VLQRFAPPPHITAAPPAWCRILASGQGPNFYLRYQKGEGETVVHGGQTPDLILMTSELKKMVNDVEIAVTK
jgi:hypothetical protein